jgi:hypothetical protein
MKKDENTTYEKSRSKIIQKVEKKCGTIPKELKDEL